MFFKKRTLLLLLLVLFIFGSFNAISATESISDSIDYSNDTIMMYSEEYECSYQSENIIADDNALSSQQNTLSSKICVNMDNGILSEDSSSSIIYVGQNTSYGGGDGSHDNPFSNFTLACDSVNGENNVTIKVFEGTYTLGSILKFNTSNLNIEGMGKVIVKNQYDDDQGDIIDGKGHCEAFALTSDLANFTFSNIIFDASDRFYSMDMSTITSFFAPFWGNANLGIYNNCTFLFGKDKTRYNMITGSEYNSIFTNCYIEVNNGWQQIFFKDFAKDTYHKFEYCILNSDMSKISGYVCLPADISMNNVWFCDNEIPSYVLKQSTTPWSSTGYTVSVSKYAFFNVTQNYLGNNQYEIIGKLTWNGTEDQEGMENFQPMTVNLQSATGDINQNATLVNGNFRAIYTSSNPNHKVTAILHNEEIELEFTTVNITTNPVSIYYGDDQNITFNFTQPITANVTVTVSNGSYNKSERVEVIGKDSLVYTVPDTLKEGTYDVEINLAENNLFGFNTTTLTVSKISDYTFDVAAGDVKVGVNATISITLPEDVTGTVIVKFGNDTKELSANQTMTVNFTNLNATTYSVNVSYSGNDKYVSLDKPASVTVNKADSGLEIEDEVFTYGDVIAIPFNVTNANGVTVTVYNKDDDEVATASSESGTINLDVLPAGKYSLEARTIVGSNYEWVSKTIDLIINKANSSINIQDKEFTYATEAIINAVTVNSTGNVIATLYDENNNEIAVSASGDNITLPLLNAGKYILSVTTNVDANHINVTKTATIIIVKATPSISVDVPETGIFEGNEIIIDVKLLGDATGLVLADINGINKLFGELNNSAVKFTLNNLVAADYNIKVTYLGDNNYNSVNKTVNIKVTAKEESNVNITIPADINIGGDSNVKIELPQKANGTVTLKIDGKVISTTPVVNGSANVSLGNLTSGNHIVEIAYSGDDKYAPVSATQIVKIEKQNVVIVVDKTFTRAAVDTGVGEKGAMFYAILKDANGNILANKTVQLAYNGVIYNKITDNQGRVGLQVNLPNAGTYPITISFAGDDTYNASPLTLAKLTVAKKKTTIKASNKVFKAKKKSKKISVTLKTVKNPYDKKTYLKSGKKVTLKVKGKTYTAKINKKGVAKFTIKLNKKGKYKAKIKFAGDNTYKASSKTIKIRIK